MANRFPLVLDTTDNNKIKEIQSGDNLNLADNSIVGVQNITAIGTIDAADIRVGGNRLVAQSFADLTDTPASFIGSPNYFVKVKADGTGLEYRPLSDLGNIEIDTITVDTSIIPSTNLVGNIGTLAARFNEIVASTLKGNLVSYNEEIVFNATTGKISYAALQGAPTFLSEFTDDVGYLRTIDLDDTFAGLFDEGQQFVTDVQGSVFGDDSTLLVDAVANIVTGNVLNSEVITTELIATTAQITTTTVSTINGPTTGNLAIDAGASGIINIGTGVSTTSVNIENAVLETFDQGTGLGAAQLTADTDLVITAGNRVKIDGGVPFGFASVSAGEQLAIGAQEGDVIYNTTTSRLQMYQDAEWKDLNGNVEATSGTSNFNDVVVAGNLTVQGTTTSIDTANTTIKDNVIVLNNGEIGAGVTGVTSGIEIDRGGLANVTFVWNETVDKWTLGSETLVAATFEGNLTGNVSGNVTGNVTGNTNGTHTGAVIGNVTGNTSGTHTGAVIGNVTGDLTGNVVGDVVGSVFGDNSTLLVDGVNGTIPWSVLSDKNILTSTSYSINTNNARGEFQFTIGFDDGNSFTLGPIEYAVPFDNYPFGSYPVGNITGNLTGDVTGSVFSDSSTLLVDGVNGVIPGTLTGSWNNPGNGFNVTGSEFNVSTESTNFIVSDSGINFGNTVDGENISLLVGNGGIALSGSGSVSIALTGAVAAATGAVSWAINGTVTLASEDLSWAVNGSVNLAADNIVIDSNGVTADLRGSVFGDDSTLLVDGVDGKIVGDVETARLRTSEIAIALGSGAGGTSQGDRAVAIGSGAGETTQGVRAVAIGGEAGETAQGLEAVAIGYQAGENTQGLAAVAIGYQAGKNTQGNQAVAVGVASGQDTQGESAVAVGWTAGQNNQGAEAVAVGYGAGRTNQAANSIVINASGSDLNNTVADSFVVKPIRNAVGTTLLMYDATSGEITHTESPVITGDVTGSVFADDSAVMVDAVNYALFSDTLSLTPLNEEPTNPVNGMIAVADGAGWDPASNARNTLVAYLGGAWVTVAAA